MKRADEAWLLSLLADFIVRMYLIIKSRSHGEQVLSRGSLDAKDATRDAVRTKIVLALQKDTIARSRSRGRCEETCAFNHHRQTDAFEDPSKF